MPLILPEAEVHADVHDVSPEVPVAEFKPAPG
jgi:hypothetical protein